MLYRFVRPLLFALPPETAHSVTLAGLQFAHRLGCVSRFAFKKNIEPVELLGLRFPNRVGLAAGMDKNGTHIDSLGALGFGFVEIGTVTPKPQAGQVEPRLFRLIEDNALINRMGFPNDGAKAIAERLRRRAFRGVCGVNIGKNFSTPLADAASDYLTALHGVYEHADYIAINISSPNTAELRRLQHGELLRGLLGALVSARLRLVRSTGRRVPLLIKLAADLDNSELSDAARAAIDCGIDGIIATNTTIARGHLYSRNSKEAGGLSGTPLLPRAMHAIALIRAVVGPDFPIVGVGGVASAHDGLAMRTAGADLVQVYSGLVYRGPGLIGELIEAL